MGKSFPLSFFVSCLHNWLVVENRGKKERFHVLLFHKKNFCLSCSSRDKSDAYTGKIKFYKEVFGMRKVFPFLACALKTQDAYTWPLSQKNGYNLLILACFSSSSGHQMWDMFPHIISTSIFEICGAWATFSPLSKPKKSPTKRKWKMLARLDHINPPILG